MKTVRVYKVSIQENILRQIIFTNRNLFFGCCSLIAYSVWQVVIDIPNDLKVFLIVVLCGGLLLISSIRVDRQSMFSILNRGLRYIFLKKQVRN